MVPASRLFTSSVLAAAVAAPEPQPLSADTSLSLSTRRWRGRRIRPVQQNISRRRQQPEEQQQHDTVAGHSSVISASPASQPSPYTPQHTAHTTAVNCVTWCPTGRYAASAAREGRDIAIWAVRLWSVTQRPRHQSGANEIAAPPGIANRSQQQNFQQRELVRRNARRQVARPAQANVELVRVLHGHGGDILALRFSNSKHFLLSASRDRTVRLWHPETALCLRVFHHQETVTALAFHPRMENVFLAASANCKLHLWSIHDTTCLAVMPTKDVVTCASCYAYGSTDQAVLGTYSGTLEIYDLYHQQQLQPSDQESSSTPNTTLSHRNTAEADVSSFRVSDRQLPKTENHSTSEEKRDISFSPHQFSSPRSCAVQVDQSSATRVEVSRSDLPRDVVRPSNPASPINNTGVVGCEELNAPPQAGPSPLATYQPQSNSSRLDPYSLITRARSLEFNLRLVAQINARSGRPLDAHRGPVRVGHKISGLAVDLERKYIVALCDDSHICKIRLDDLTAFQRQRGPNVSAAASSTTRAAISLDGHRAVTGSDSGLQIFRLDQGGNRLSRDQRETRKKRSKRRRDNRLAQSDATRHNSQLVGDANAVTSNFTPDVLAMDLTISGGSDTDAGLALPVCSGKDRSNRKSQKATAKRAGDKVSNADRPTVLHPLCTLAGRNALSKICAAAIAPPCIHEESSLNPEDTLVLVGLGNGNVLLSVMSGSGNRVGSRRTSTRPV